MRANLKEHFDTIYKNKSWVLEEGDPLSGPGSRPDYCKPFVDWFCSYIADNNVTSMVDYGCGDGAMWYRFPEIDYVGIDVSQVALNAASARHPGKKYQLLFEPIPSAELILIKDVMIHLSDDEIQDWIDTVSTKFDTVVIVERDMNNDVDRSFRQYDRHEHLSYWGYCPIDITRFYQTYERVDLPELVADVFIINRK